ncbi:hypothetical protein CPT_MarsHill_221 [Staphylococcus phage MarsHill]|nr:hypothetical protein CPT_MarsHill_221 [Staphylococcus phage MarsHill]QQO92873.1 hypothetical protein CPT_Madawaska_224 [Staphylococcus phage Madawaska]
MSEVKVNVDVINEERGITGIRTPQKVLELREGDLVEFKFSPSNREEFNENDICFIEQDLDDEGSIPSTKIPFNDFVKEKGKYKKYQVAKPVRIYITTESDEAPIDSLEIKIEE